MSTIRGIVVAEPDLVLSSAATPIGPIPGRVTEAEGQSSALALETSGSIVGSLSPSPTLQIVRAGLPGDVQILWKEKGGYLGWDAPHVAHTLRKMSTTSGSHRPAHAIRLASGGWLVAAIRDDLAVDVFGAFGSVNVYERGSAFSSGNLEATLVQLPNGKVLLFHWFLHGSSLQVRAWRSEDDGETWALHQSYCLSDALSTALYAPQRLRVARIGDALILVAHALHSSTEDRLLQFASLDDGCHWTWICEVDGGSRGYPEILVLGGRAIIVYLAYRSASMPNVLPYARTLSSAFEPLTDVDSNVVVDQSGFEWGSQSGGVITSGELTGFVLGSELWIFGRNHDAQMEIHTASSGDGATWTLAGACSTGIDAGRIWAGGSTSIYPSNIVAAPYLGGLSLWHCWEGGVDPDGLYLIEMGGYRPATIPFQDSPSDAISDQSSWTYTYLPSQEPNLLAPAIWTTATSGTPTVSANGATLSVVSSGVGDSKSWTASVTSSPSNGMTVEADCTPGNGKAYLDICVSGASRYEVRASWNGVAEWTLRDLVAGADLGTVDCSQAGPHHRLLIGVSEDGAWLQVVEVPDLADGMDGLEIGTASGVLSSGSATSDSVQFGSLSGGLAGTEAQWHGVYWAQGSDTGLGLSTGQSITERQGRPVGGEPIWLTAGLHLRALEGPGSRGEIWSVEGRYSYQTSNADPLVVRNPLVTARWAAPPSLVWRWTDDLPRIAMGLPCVYLEGFNFRKALLEYQEIGGGWQTIGTVDLAVASGLGWSRAGNSILAEATGGSSTRFPTEILKDGYFLSVAGTDRVWPIVAQEGGRWLDPSLSGQVARLRIAGATSGDPTSGTTGAIIPPRALICFPPSLFSTPFQALRLTPLSKGAAATDPSSGESYFKVGIALAGHLAAFGRQYSLGRVAEIAIPSEVLRGRGNQVLSARRLGRNLRAVEFSWADGQDEYPLSLTTIPSIAVYGAEIGTPAGVLGDVYGLLDRIGQDTPVVYASTIAFTSANNPLVITPTLGDLIYGIAETEVFRLDTVMGNENKEVRRSGTIRIVEV